MPPPGHALVQEERKLVFLCNANIYRKNKQTCSPCDDNIPVDAVSSRNIKKLARDIAEPATAPRRGIFTAQSMPSLSGKISEWKDKTCGAAGQVGNGDTLYGTAHAHNNTLSLGCF